MVKVNDRNGFRSRCFAGKFSTVLRWICPLMVSFNWLQAEFLDTSSRWLVRDFYLAKYAHAVQPELGWQGSFDPPKPGDASEAWQQAVLDRVNFFRIFAGVPGGVTLRQDWSAAAQQAALTMALEGRISHYLDASWPEFTEAGAEAARRGNLAMGIFGLEAVTGYILEHGSDNFAVGHRRWLLYPQMREIGNADVPAANGIAQFPVNVMWVIDPEASARPRPQTRDDFVAWPPAGYVPAQLVYARWSFSLPQGAQFTEETLVEMFEGPQGTPVPLRRENLQGGFGDATLVWVPFCEQICTDFYGSWMDANLLTVGDRTFNVKISDVFYDGDFHDFEYTVTVFDGRVPGGEEQATEVVAPDRFQPRTLQTFDLGMRSWADDIGIRVMQAQPFDRVLNGSERDGLPFVAEISPGYIPYDFSRKVSGIRGYLLNHVQDDDDELGKVFRFRDEVLRLPNPFIVSSISAKLTFKSSRAWSTGVQESRVEVRLDGEANWQTLWMDNSEVLDLNTSFIDVDVSLAEFIGKKIEIRFNFAPGGNGSYFFGPWDGLGWAFDDVTLDGVMEVTSVLIEEERFDDPTATALVLPPLEGLFIQAREYVFGGFALPWGPLTALPAPLAEGIVAEAQEWVTDAVLGDIFGAEETDWVYSAALGWVEPGFYPWLFSQTQSASAWLYHLHGNIEDGLWLYHAEEGYIYTDATMNGSYLVAPFTAADRRDFY